MAHDWWNQKDDIYMRRGDDRTRGGSNLGRHMESESYRAGDQDAHRNDREMAYGNFNQRPSDQYPYSRHDSGRREEIGRRDEFRTNTWDRDFSRSYGNDEPRHTNASNYESSRFYRTYGNSYAGRGPKNYRRSDERIREDVSEVLERDAYIDASEIEVDVKEGVVTLRGHTEDRRQKRMAEDAIENLSGVKDVRNELTVDQTLFQQAKEALFGGSTEAISDSSRGDLVSDGTTQTKTRNPRH